MPARQAGFFWLQLDPSWTLEGPPLQRVFMLDGTTEPGNRDDPFWGELLAAAGWLAARAGWLLASQNGVHESCHEWLFSEMHLDCHPTEAVRACYNRPVPVARLGPHVESWDSIHSPGLFLSRHAGMHEMRWRFCKSKEGVKGTYVKVRCQWGRAVCVALTASLRHLRCCLPCAHAQAAAPPSLPLLSGVALRADQPVPQPGAEPHGEWRLAHGEHVGESKAALPANWTMHPMCVRERVVADAA